MADNTQHEACGRVGDLAELDLRGQQACDPVVEERGPGEGAFVVAARGHAMERSRSSCSIRVVPRPRLRVLPPLLPPRPTSTASALATFLLDVPVAGADAAVWSAELVAAFRRDQPAASPRGGAQAVAKFGVSTCLLTLIAWGQDAPVAPPHLAALMNARNFLDRPRRTALRMSVEAVAMAPTGPDLVSSLARLLSRAALAKDVDQAASLATDAVERLARARGPGAVRAALLRTEP